MEGFLDEQDYVVESVLSALAICSVAYLDFSNSLSYLTLLFVPMLYGYTAFISRDGFRKASIVSIVALLFVTQSEVMAVLSVIIGFGNILVSYFSSGIGFKSFYSSVTLPLLCSGLVLGLMFFGAVTASPKYAENLENKTADYIAEETQKFIDKTGLIVSQRNVQVKMVETVSKSSIRLTEAYVYNQTQGELDRESWNAVNNAFKSARTEVPSKISEQVSRSGDSSSTVSRQTKAIVSNLFQKESLVLGIPLIIFGIFTLNPVLGILTGLFGVIFTKINYWQVPE